MGEGEQPSTYIPATKRREIYTYMQQVNYNKHTSEGKCHLNSTIANAELSDALNLHPPFYL